MKADCESKSYGKIDNYGLIIIVIMGEYNFGYLVLEYYCYCATVHTQRGI